MTVSNGAGDNGLLLKAVFWDMDGTLIDSEPYWHEGELKIAAEHGGYWDEDLAWQGSGTPVPDVARRMVEHGCQLSIEEIGKGMIDYVAQKEFERIPWIAGVEDVLRSLAAAGVPSRSARPVSCSSTIRTARNSHRSRDMTASPPTYLMPMCVSASVRESGLGVL